MIKKLFNIIFLMLIIANFQTYSKNRFFLQNRLGNLIKVDVASGLVKKLPVKKGPRTDEVPLEITVNEVNEKILPNLTGDEKILFLSHYTLNDNSGNYIIDDKTGDAIKNLKKIHNILTNYSAAISYFTSISTKQFENKILPKITNEEDQTFIKSVYEKTGSNKYLLIVDVEEPEKLREIFLKLNKENEMYTGLDEHGTPMPHKFPRVFEPKTKANFDIHFAWGVKFDPIRNSDNVEIGYITFGFSLNLTNFIMPSLEFLLKYNIILYGYPVEPYVGAILYGGFLDGFPIGLSAIGGVDVFPFFFEKITQNKNFYLTGEFRLGTVLYSRIYYDTGLNNEGIWKKLELLAEGGFYFGYGYIFENNL